MKRYLIFNFLELVEGESAYEQFSRIRNMLKLFSDFAEFEAGERSKGSFLRSYVFRIHPFKCSIPTR